MNNPLLTRLEPRALPIEFHHQSFLRGGRNYRKFTATVRDGVLRVIAGEEPFNNDGKFLTHLSMSVGTDGGMDTPPFRRPNREETSAVAKLLCPQMIFDEEGSNALCAHLWQVEAEGGK